MVITLQYVFINFWKILEENPFSTSLSKCLRQNIFQYLGKSLNCLKFVLLFNCLNSEQGVMYADELAFTRNISTFAEVVFAWVHFFLKCVSVLFKLAAFIQTEQNSWGSVNVWINFAANYTKKLGDKFQIKVDSRHILLKKHTLKYCK